jgi:uncharacterized RDD family membrane protein YckC
MGLEVVSMEGKDVNWEISIRRNLPLAVASICSIVPVIGWLIGMVVGVIIGIIEIVLVLTDNNGRRLGDRLANTQVVYSESVHKGNDIIDI